MLGSRSDLQAGLALARARPGQVNLPLTALATALRVPLWLGGEGSPA